MVRNQTNLDLHWNALWPQRRADADRLFWEGAQRIDHQGRPAYALAPTDELFHACMHGARLSQNAYSWAPFPLIRWITDAFMIARRCDVDWGRINALAERFHAKYRPDLERLWGGATMPPNRVMFRIAPERVQSRGLSA